MVKEKIAPRFSERNGIDLLKEALEEDEDERESAWAEVILEINEKTRSDFDWNLFWSLVRDDDFYKDLSDSMRYRLWGFLKKDCSPKTYDEFVLLLSEVPKDFVFLAKEKDPGSDQSKSGGPQEEADNKPDDNNKDDEVDPSSVSPRIACQNNLSIETWSIVTPRFYEYVLKNLRRSGDFIRYVNLGLRLERDSRVERKKIAQLARSIPNSKMRQIVEQAAHEELSETIDFIDTVEGKANLPKFANEVTGSIISEESKLVSFLKRQKRISLVLSLFRRADSKIFRRLELSKEMDLHEFMRHLTRAFHQENGYYLSVVPENAQEKLRASDAVRKALRQLKELRAFDNHAYAGVTNDNRRRWLNETHEFIEKLFWIQGDLSLEIFDELLLADADPDYEWLRFRWYQHFQKGIEDYQPVIPDWEAATELDRLVWSRLSVRLAANLEAQREAVKTHCLILKREYGAKVHGSPQSPVEITNEWLEKHPVVFRLPGCHVIRKTPGKRLYRETEDLGSQLPTVKLVFEQHHRMDPDTIIIAPGMSFDIAATSFDGSVFDLSADQEWEPKPLPEVPESLDAVLFPVVIGMKNRTNKIEFFPMHLVYRESKSSEELVTPLLDGVSGGSIRIAVKNSDASVVPTVISQGGKGQVWSENKLKSGSGARSTIDFEGMVEKADWFKDLRARPVPDLGGAEPISVNPDTYIEMDDLLKRSADGEGDYEIYIDPRYISALGPGTRRTILNHEKDRLRGLPEYQESWDALHPTFAEILERLALKQLLSAAQAITPENYLRPFELVGIEQMEDYGKNPVRLQNNATPGKSGEEDFNGFYFL